MTTTVVLASRNAHKIEELGRILADAGLAIELVGVEAFPDVAEVAETGETFAANALLKARAVAAATGLPAVGDDSGLCVDALNGMPGIFSARWSGRRWRPRQPRAAAGPARRRPARAAGRSLRVRGGRRHARRPNGCRRGPARRARDHGAPRHQRLRLRPGLRPASTTRTAPRLSSPTRPRTRSAIGAVRCASWPPCWRDLLAPPAEGDVVHATRRVSRTERHPQRGGAGCGRRDSNPHTRRRRLLRPLRLPVPPLPLGSGSA